MVIMYFLIATLVLAWLVTDVLLHLITRLRAPQPRKTNKRTFKRRITRKRILSGLNAATVMATAVLVLMPVRSPSQPTATNYNCGTMNDFEPSHTNIWQHGVGNGFKLGVQSVSVGIGGGYGVQILGSRQSHDLALISISYGQMICPVQGEGHWYRGNWELRG